MSTKGRGPRLRALWLGQQMRELRESTGRSLQDAADYLHRSTATISRLETGDYPARRGDVLALMDLYGVSDERRRDGLIKLSEEVWRKGWWNGYTDQIPGSVIDYSWLEDRATAIRSLDLVVIPGILQTQGYAEALTATMEPDAPAEQRARWVEFRMARQHVLDKEDAPQLAVLLDEALLRRRIGGPEVMRAQLRHLAAMAERPNVEIRVLPFGVGAHTGHEGAFTLVEMPEPYPDVVYVETPAGAIFVEEPDTERFTKAYDRSWKASLGPKESVELISAAEELQ